MTILSLPPPPADHRLPYGDNPLHFGDLRLPQGNGPFPLVMNIHGGFWRSQYSLDHAGHLCAALAEAGIATWNIEYRRLGQRGGGWTGTFEDVALAADYLPTLAQSYPLDLSRTAVMGHSAGGHLALWVAARTSFAPTHPLYTPAPFAFKGVVALAPVADLVEAWELGLSGTVVEKLLGGSPASHPERYAAASPIALLPLQMPQILVHGVQDDIVPIAISEGYLKASQVANNPCRLERLANSGHFEVIDPFAPAWASVQAAVQSVLGDEIDTVKGESEK